jgi:hypothetical protein
MVPYRSQKALRNLKLGAKKMETAMTPAARVRREFRLGRPPKGMLPLHPTVAWQKAESLLTDFRQKMKAAALLPEHVDAQIIGVRDPNPDEPVFLAGDRDAALKTLSTPDIIAIGCIFRQYDARSKQDVFFFVQFTGLSERGLNVLKKACTMLQDAAKKLGAKSMS